MLSGLNPYFSYRELIQTMLDKGVNNDSSTIKINDTMGNI